MSRFATIAERERAVAATTRAEVPDRRMARRMRFISQERLSLPEASYLSDGFDPGPEYDFPIFQEPAL